MLRYRDSLGLLPAVRERAARRPAGPPGGQPGRSPGHRRFGQHDLDAVALALAIEQRYDISPAALAFGLRVLADPAARAEVAELGRGGPGRSMSRRHARTGCSVSPLAHPAA